MQSVTFPNQDDLSLDLHEEEIVVTHVAKQGDTVQVSTRTLSRDQMVEAGLTHERVEIERVPIGREVEVAPPDPGGRR